MQLPCARNKIPDSEKSPIRSKMVISGSLTVKLPVKNHFQKFLLNQKLRIEISGGVLGDSFLYDDRMGSYQRKTASWRKIAKKRRNC